MCDVAYVLLLDRLERQVLADRHVAAVLMAAGAKGVELPAFEKERAAFDAALIAEPVPPRPMTTHEVEQRELREALGVA